MKKQLIDFYLDYRNDWLTVDSYARHHNLSLESTTALIQARRELWIQKNIDIAKDFS